MVVIYRLSQRFPRFLYVQFLEQAFVAVLGQTVATQCGENISKFSFGDLAFKFSLGEPGNASVSLGLHGFRFRFSKISPSG